MIATCRTELLSDTQAGYLMLREMKLDVRDINIISDANIPDFKMTCFTIEIPEGKSVDDVSQEMLTLVLKEERFVDLHRLAQTLREGDKTKF